MLKAFSSIVAVVAIGSGIVIAYIFHHVPNRPDLDLTKWWGIGLKPREEDIAIKHFNLDFNDTMISDLKQRIRNRRPFTKPLEESNSHYGMNTVYLDTIMINWLEKYNFKERAKHLNRFPHYKTRIQGLDIHFIRVKPTIKGNANIKVLPLLMLHGWPSSSKEFDKVIPILTTQKTGYDFVFEVIAPDLPGFGFSEGTNKPGLTPVQIGIMMRNLMIRLNFKKFYVHAGDWGSQCATHMATLFPDEILGFHTNMPLSSMHKSWIKLFIGSLFPRLIDRSNWNRIYPLKTTLGYVLKESGYFHIQATKPDTIGVALSDSPAGLAAYIMEKMAICSNRDQLDTPHGGLENLNIDDVLDTVTIVWANNCAVTSMRIYAEGIGRHPEVNTVHNIPTKVPTAAIKFLYEVLYQPDWLLRDKFHNLVKSTVVDFGGHFAALQTPNVLADDIFEATVAFTNFHAKHNKK